MNEENQPNSNEPTEPVLLQSAPQTPTPEIQPSPVNQRSKKGPIIVVVTLLLVALIGAGVAYYLIVYLPNTPENVFKKAVSNLAQEGNYTVKGRLDQGDGNSPDFNYEIKTNGSDVYARVDTTTFLMSPSMEVLRIDGKTYVNASNWLDKAGLAERYLNYGEKGIQEYLSEFAVGSGLYSKQGTWIQIDDWVFDGVATTDNNSTPSTIEEAGVSIESIGESEDRDGRQVIVYKVSVTKDGFSRLLGTTDSSSILKSAFEEYSNENGFPDSISMNMEVDIDTKTVQKVTYEGRPFRDATLSLEMTAAENSFAVPENTVLASQALRYGLVWSKLFNPIFQAESGSGFDSERVADIKGIKMALEMHKAQYGEYPGRMEIAVNGESYLYDRMPNTDPEVFKDPNGRFIGMHGSQYAYVAYTSDDSEMCGPNNGAKCEKYFIATTLDNGQEYKLTSEQ